MSNQLYEVPIIHQDLRQEDTIIQIAHALQYLKESMDNLLSNIEGQVSEKKDKLQNIQKRINGIHLKIEKLRGSKKATKVIASAKYPAMDSYSNYRSMFEDHEPLILPCPSAKISSKFPPVEKKVLQEKLQFYHVKMSNKLLHRNIEISHEEGLGKLPLKINSVTSLLLFNTSENPYKQYVMMDPLGTVRKTKHIPEEEDETLRMEAAPLSISQKDEVKRPMGENYFYSPGLGDVPQLDVPLDLPDLPGIADDLRFSMDSGPMIAPSVSTSTFVKSQETKESVESSPAKAAATPSLKSLFANEPLPTASVSEPKMSDASKPHVDISIPSSKPASGPPPPPPPPPLPPVDLSPITPEDGASTVPVKAKPAPASDVRANLMEAIRKAGGTGKAQLRNAADRKIEAKRKKQEMKAINTTGGDLMADLHIKLSRRRKGISGANKSEAVASAMEKVSAMIPPPPRPEGVPVSGTEDESDWDA